MWHQKAIVLKPIKSSSGKEVVYFYKQPRVHESVDGTAAPKRVPTSAQKMSEECPNNVRKMSEDCPKDVQCE